MTPETLRPWDKLMPGQAYNAELFAGEAAALPRAIYDAVSSASGLRPPTEEFDLTLSPRFSIEQMASSPVMLRFLQVLVGLCGAKRVVEIGAFIGLSALYMAKALPTGGKVLSIEKFDEFAAIARENFRRNALSDRIDLVVGDAFDVVGALPPDTSFDLAFIDGNKERYADYFDMLAPRMRPGGLVIVDDALFHGDAMNAPPRTEKGLGARRMLDRAAELRDWRRVLLPVSNGMLLLVKPSGGA